MTETSIRRDLLFRSDALPHDPLRVVSLTGTEALNQPYRFEIRLVSEEVDIDLEAVVDSRARLTIKQAASNGGRLLHQIHGVIASMDQMDRTRDGFAQYQVVLVPSICRGSQPPRTRAFPHSTLAGILEEVLESNGLEPEDFDLSGLKNPRERADEFQCGETDMGFLQRLAVRHGIFFHFLHREDREVLIFGDNPMALVPIAGSYHVSYTGNEEESGVHALAARRDSEKTLFRGRSDVRSFRAGAVFRLERHFRDDFNRDYVLMEVRHDGRPGAYRNEYLAVPAGADIPRALHPQPRSPLHLPVGMPNPGTRRIYPYLRLA